MESLRDPGFPNARERGNFRIRKRVTNRKKEGEDELDERMGIVMGVVVILILVI